MAHVEILRPRVELSLLVNTASDKFQIDRSMTFDPKKHGQFGHRLGMELDYLVCGIEHDLTDADKAQLCEALENIIVELGPEMSADDVTIDDLRQTCRPWRDMPFIQTENPAYNKLRVQVIEAIAADGSPDEIDDLVGQYLLALDERNEARKQDDFEPDDLGGGPSIEDDEDTLRERAEAVSLQRAAAVEEMQAAPVEKSGHPRRSVGDRFMDGETLIEVVPHGGCAFCYYRNTVCASGKPLQGECVRSKRRDGDAVMYRKVDQDKAAPQPAEAVEE